MQLHAPLWRRRDDFWHVEIIGSSRVKGSTQIWALALLALHARREDEDEELPMSTPNPSGSAEAPTYETKTFLDEYLRIHHGSQYNKSKVDLEMESSSGKRQEALSFFVDRIYSFYQERGVRISNDFPAVLNVVVSKF